MLTSIVSTTVASTSAAAGVISMTTPIGLPGYGVLAVIALIILLSAKEILSASEQWNKAVSCSLNMCILPLLISFVLIILFKAGQVLQ